MERLGSQEILDNIDAVVAAGDAAAADVAAAPPVAFARDSSPVATVPAPSDFNATRAPGPFAAAPASSHDGTNMEGLSSQEIPDDVDAFLPAEAAADASATAAPPAPFATAGAPGHFTAPPAPGPFTGAPASSPFAAAPVPGGH